MAQYGLHGKLAAKPGKVDALADILVQAAKMMQSAEGCLLYSISTDKKEPSAIWVTEIWTNKTAHDESLKNEEVRNLIAEAMPLLDGSPAGGQELSVLYSGL